MGTLLDLLRGGKLIPESVVRRDIVGVSPATWHRMRKDNLLPPAIVIRRRRFYRPDVIEEWLRNMEVAA